jgi:hypothetical protein
MIQILSSMFLYLLLKLSVVNQCKVGRQLHSCLYLLRTDHPFYLIIPHPKPSKHPRYKQQQSRVWFPYMLTVRFVAFYRFLQVNVHDIWQQNANYFFLTPLPSNWSRTPLPLTSSAPRTSLVTCFRTSARSFLARWGSCRALRWGLEPSTCMNPREGEFLFRLKCILYNILWCHVDIIYITIMRGYHLLYGIIWWRNDITWWHICEVAI